MNSFMNNLAIATILTLDGYLRDLNRQMREVESEKRVSIHRGVILHDGKRKIIDIANQIIRNADKACNTESDFDIEASIDLLLCGCLYHMIDTLPVSKSAKVSFYDEASRSLQLNREYSGGMVFHQGVGEELLEGAVKQLLRTYIAGDSHSKESRLFLEMVRLGSDLLLCLSAKMNESHPNDGFSNEASLYLAEQALAACEDVMQEMEEHDLMLKSDVNNTRQETERAGDNMNIVTEEMSLQEQEKIKLRQYFDGRIVRKDLTKKIKEGANVPVYVLEFLLGQYCSSDDEEVIAQGVNSVKKILADNFVRPDEAEKVLSRLRQRGSYTVIDKITMSLNLRFDEYEAEFSNLGVKGIPIDEFYAEKYDRLLCGGIWCIVQLEYNTESADSGIILMDKKAKKPQTLISIRKLTPIQMPHVDIEELKRGRKAFTKEEWIDVMLRSIGMEPDRLTEREKWLLLCRMLPLVENNFNLCELGPRSTGKSHLFKEISPNSILVSGGQTTVANLFYNMARKTVGLVGLWDCVAFDEVAGINFKDKDGIQIMKDYMASGSFARGKEEKAASASMVFVGNINQSVDVLLKTSSLFDPFPPEMGTDTAFLDRMHCYLPGWEIPKFRPEHFTDGYGFITDYLAEFLRELRKEQHGDALDQYFKLGKNLNQRDTIAVRKMVGGMVKLLYPDSVYTKEQLEEILKLALEMRRRVKEQLKKLGGMEFYDVNFSYIDQDTFEEHFVSVPEQGGGKLIPEGMGNPGQVYTIGQGKSGMIGVFRLEAQMLPGNGRFDRTGIGSDREAREATNTAFHYLKANGNRISASISTTSKDYIINYQDLQGIGMTSRLALPTLISLCSIALGKPSLSSMAVLGEISISGTMIKAEELANILQVCLDSGAKKVLLPITSAADLGTVPPELIGCFNLIFYNSAEDAIFKALGVE